MFDKDFFKFLVAFIVIVAVSLISFIILSNLHGS